MAKKRKIKGKRRFRGDVRVEEREGEQPIRRKEKRSHHAKKPILWKPTSVRRRLGLRKEDLETGSRKNVQWTPKNHEVRTHI